MTRTPASKLADAADALLDWLHSQSPTTGRRAGASLPSPDVALPDPDGHPTAQAAPVLPPVDPPSWPPERPGPGADTQAVLAQAAPLRLAHTDWLYHRLTVTGPADRRGSARPRCGRGRRHPLAARPRPPGRGSLSTRSSPHRPRSSAASASPARASSPTSCATAVAARHALAVARVGRSRACPFDLHALLPVPAALLRRGPDDPAALAWLWTHWGTTEALRHVTRLTAAFPTSRPRRRVRPSFRVTFWSADWTPWRALVQLAEQWPALRFTLQPRYDAA